MLDFQDPGRGRTEPGTVGYTQIAHFSEISPNLSGISMVFAYFSKVYQIIAHSSLKFLNKGFINFP